MNDSLSLTYTLTMDDVVAWNQYHFAHSASYKRLYWVQIVFLCAIMFAAALAGIGCNATGVGVAVLVTGILFCVILAQRKRGVARYVKKAYAEGKNRGMIGQHRLIITDDGLTSNTEAGEGKTFWAGIERIVEVPGYSFIYIGAFMAHVIPEQRIADGDYNTFMAELKRRWEEAQKGQATL